MERPEIAIVEPNTLAALGLKHLLEEITPQAVVRLFHSFTELADDTPDMFVHYFVSSKIFFEHAAFFTERKQRTIVLAGGDNQPQLSGMVTLDTGQGEKDLLKSILKIREHGHGKIHQVPGKDIRSRECPLSAREKEVLILVVKGYINKEIADRLCISQTTVITHRKNIAEKLGIKSVAALTVYAVMQGLIEADAV